VTEIPDISTLDHEPVGGPTQMTRAHQNGMRKVLARAKSWFKPEHQAEPCLKVALLTYLGEWERVYDQGTRILGLTQTERTIMAIRQDTVQQILRELA
jgi:hypothetical protein